MNAVVHPTVPALPRGLALRRAFAGVWLLTWRRFVAPRHALSTLAAIAILGGLTWLQGRNDPHLLEWTASSYLSFLAPLVAFVTAAGAMRDELKSPTSDYILTRAIPRPAFIAFKFTAYIIGVEIEFLVALGTLAVVGQVLHTAGLAAAFPTLVLMQFGLVLAFSGLGFLCGVLTSRYMVVGLLYGAVVEIGVGQIPTQLSRLSLTRQVRERLEPFLSIPPAGPAHDGNAFSTLLVLVAFALVTLAAAIALFSWRELAERAEA